MLFIGAFFMALTGFALTATLASAVRRRWTDVWATLVVALIFGGVGVAFLARAVEGA